MNIAMREMTKKRTRMSNSTSPSLAMHTNSQIISKVKPKIRIIHIFAPEIIKTDVANFRELVQRLTGKPQEKSGRKMSRFYQKEEQRMKECKENMKDEQEKWRGEISGGFLNGFADMDGFMQELTQLPLLPLDPANNVEHQGSFVNI